MAKKQLILVVDDEWLIVEFLVDQLEEAGFAVISEPSGNGAIATFDAHAKEVIALITDVRLGTGPSGWDVAHHARTCVPTMPVIYMTADSAAEWAANGVPNSILIQKPFVAAQIITAVSQLLNAQSSNPPPMS
jgi:DNA-binding response OmpR family regulator